MLNFIHFKSKMQEKFQQLVKEHDTLYLTDVSKDMIWETYLEGFPEGTNNIFKERREYDCNNCKQFLRPYGNIVAIKNNELISIWDIEVEHPYQEVTDKLSALVKSKPITNVFVIDFNKLGIDKNRQLLASGEVKVWNHFSFKLPKEFVNKSSHSNEALQGDYRSIKQVFKRSLEEISMDAIHTTVELIKQGSIYRGEESLSLIELFLGYKKVYSDLPENQKDNYCWKTFKGAGPVAKIRNNAIGTLLTDISEGKELDYAVSAFEKIMAPSNYKRPNAIVTKRMIEDAKNKITELGFENSLSRRHAVSEDITVNNVLFANRDARKAMSADPFDKLEENVSDNLKNFSKVENVNIEDFISAILPTSTSVELMFEGKHSGNLMSLLSPMHKVAPTMFKWNNNFSWSYNGDIADSMKQRVKEAGGNVEGVLRFSIQWNDGDDNKNDFDAHCIEPRGNHIYYSSKKNYDTRGNLDVDIINPGHNIAVENITWPDIHKMEEGKYKFYVRNYSHNGGRTGFTAEIEYEGQIYSYTYDRELKQDEDVLVALIDFSKRDGIKFIKSLDSTVSSKEIWSINTNKFHQVSMVLNSPNHWDGNKTGNKHYFFIINKCLNEYTPRGFFNEFLKEDLMKHKRVFEALGSMMKVEESDDQLSGLGFSSTKRNSVICKVEGAFNRTIKINF